MNPISQRLEEAFNPDTVIAAAALWLPNLVVAVVTIVFFWLLLRGAVRTVDFVMKRAEVDETAISFVQTLVRYAVVTVALVTVLGQVGVDVTGILTSLGVVGLTVGFAARDALSNIISGLFIFWDRPFVIGDLVEIGGSYGEVSAITMRSTRVVTPDGKMLAIPNSEIVNSTVASYTNFPHLRIDVDATIGVGEDIGRVRRILLDLIADAEGYMKTPAPVVVVTALGDYANTVELRAWLEREKGHVAARFALRERVFVALTEAGIDMPYETLSLTPVELKSQMPAAS